MQSYDRFIFDSFTYDPDARTIVLRYSLDNEVKFEEKLILPDLPLAIDVNDPRLDAALFALHLVGGVSYYKTCLPKNMEVWSGTLSKKQAQFWNDVYQNGLGEFFYKNKVDFRGLINFPVKEDLDGLEKNRNPKPENDGVSDFDPRISALVPIGGGKDSVATIELLKKAGVPVTLLRLGSHPLIDKQAEIAGAQLIKIERHLSPLLFALNEQGALNGHVPITAYLSCVSVIAALLYGHRAIALSNERSANDGNVEYLGMTINHQWSKGLEFERAFQKYLTESVDVDLQYFSLLRPLSELGIAKIFASARTYHEAATSCNTNWRIVKEKPKEKWCRKCPKCAFAFAILSAFLEEQKLIGMFGGNLFDDPELLPTFKELLGLEGIKPFECVGTPDETKAALILAKEHGWSADSPVMKMFAREVTAKDPKTLIEECMTPSKDHAIPEMFLSKVEPMFVL